MKDMKNKPRISKWIGRGYLLLTVFIAVLYTAIALWANIFSFPYAGIFFTVVMVFVLVLIGATTYSFYKTVYVVKEGFLYSSSPFAVINLGVKDITKIEQTRIPVSFKGFGATLYSGWFYIPALGWTKVIITNLTDGVLITDKNKKHYLITPSNPSSFVKLMRERMNSDNDGIRKRIEKDIELFSKNVASVKGSDKNVTRILELSKMYAQDSKSYLDRGDFYTSFSCISYAHGLLDAIKELQN